MAKDQIQEIAYLIQYKNNQRIKCCYEFNNYTVEGIKHYPDKCLYIQQKESS